MRRTIALAAFGALIAFGCVLRFWKLTDGLWYDELWTVVGASDRPFMETYREWILGDAHPPGFFVFYFAWFKIFPNTEFWARIPSAIAGLLTVAYVLFGTRKVLSKDERIMSASLIAFSSSYIFYALTVKQYSAMLLFATIATVTYLEIVKAGRVDRRTGLTFCASSICLAWLNYFALAYAWILLALLALTFRRNREELRRVARTALVYGLAHLPIAYFIYLQLTYSPGDWQTYRIESFWSEWLPSVFFDGGTFLKAALAILAGSLSVAVIASEENQRQLWSNRNRHLLLILMAFSGFMLVLGISKPIFFVRFFLVAFPALFMALGILTAAAFPIDKGWLAVLPLLFLLKASTVQFETYDTMQRQQWDKSVDLVLQSRQPGDRVYVLGARTDKTSFDYLKEGNVDGVYGVRNVRFYEYYLKRRGADELAARLEVVEPTIKSVMELAGKFHDSGTTIYVLAGHHIQYRDNVWKTLERVSHKVTAIPMGYSTFVYRIFRIRKTGLRPTTSSRPSASSTPGR